MTQIQGAPFVASAMCLSQYFEYEVQSEYINENFVQLEIFTLCCYVELEEMLKLKLAYFLWEHSEFILLFCLS